MDSQLRHAAVRVGSMAPWIEAANFALSYSPPIKRWYDRKASTRHKVIAIKAVAHKLARAGYYLMRDGGTFDVARAFG